jgi:hypothetical protein
MQLRKTACTEAPARLQLGREHSTHACHLTIVQVEQDQPLQKQKV